LLHRLNRLVVQRGMRLQCRYLDRFQSARGCRRLHAICVSLSSRSWRGRCESELQRRELWLVGFFFFALACTADKLEVGIVCLIFCDAVTVDMLPNTTLFTRNLGRVVVLRTLAWTDTHDGVNLPDWNHKFRTSHSQRTSPLLR
jgi:hypothetical protein